MYDRTATPDWPWFEEILSYDIARLPQALIASGPVRPAAPWTRSRPADPGLAGRGPDRPAGTLPADRLQRLLPQGAKRRPGSTSSRSRPTRRSPPAWRRTAPPRTAPGWTRPAPRSSGSSAATTWARSCTTRRPAGAATACRRTASTGTRGPNRPWPSSCRWPRCGWRPRRSKDPSHWHAEPAAGRGLAGDAHAAAELTRLPVTLGRDPSRVILRAFRPRPSRGPITRSMCRERPDHRPHPRLARATCAKLATCCLSIW